MGKSKTPIDVRRVIRAAVEAALEDPVPPPRRKRRLSSGRVLLVGAGVVTAGKLAASSRGREVFDTIRDRVGAIEDRFLGSDDDLPEDEEELDEQEEFDAQEEDELDEDEPEGELEDDEEPIRNAPRRRGRGRRS